MENMACSKEEPPDVSPGPFDPIRGSSLSIYPKQPRLNRTSKSNPMYPNLSDRFPILEVDNDHIVSKMGDRTIAYALTRPEIFTLSKEDFQALHEVWAKAIRILPPNTTLHIQDRFVRSRY